MSKILPWIILGIVSGLATYAHLRYKRNYACPTISEDEFEFFDTVID